MISVEVNISVREVIPSNGNSDGTIDVLEVMGYDEKTMSRSSNGQPESLGSRIGEDPEINSSSEDIPIMNNNVYHQPSKIQHIIGPTDDTRFENQVQDAESSFQVTDSLRKLKVINMWGVDIDLNVTPMTSELSTLSPSLTCGESSVGFSPEKFEEINFDLDLNEAPCELKMTEKISGVENRQRSPTPMMSLDLNDTPSDGSTLSDQNHPFLYESPSHKTSSYAGPCISDPSFFKDYLGTWEEYDFLPFSSGSSARKRKDPDTGWDLCTANYKHC